MKLIRKMQTAAGGPLNYDYSIQSDNTRVVNPYIVLPFTKKLWGQELLRRNLERRRQAVVTSDNRSTWLKQQDLKKAKEVLLLELEIKNQEAATKAAEGLMRIASPSTYVGFAMGNTQGTGTGSLASDFLTDALVFGGPNLIRAGLNSNTFKGYRLANEFNKAVNKGIILREEGRPLILTYNDPNNYGFPKSFKQIGAESEQRAFLGSDGYVYKMPKYGASDGFFVTKNMSINLLPNGLGAKTEFIGIRKNPDGTKTPIIRLEYVDPIKSRLLYLDLMKDYNYDDKFHYILFDNEGLHAVDDIRPSNVGTINGKLKIFDIGTYKTPKNIQKPIIKTTRQEPPTSLKFFERKPSTTIQISPEELYKVFKDQELNGYYFMGHGTGRTNVNPLVIFDNGLRIKSGDIGNTTSPISESNLSLWPHANSKEVIILPGKAENVRFDSARGRIPSDWYDSKTFQWEDNPGFEGNGLFAVLKPNATFVETEINGVPGVYTKPEAILGSYNIDTHTLKLNPKSLYEFLFNTPRTIIKNKETELYALRDNTGGSSKITVPDVYKSLTEAAKYKGSKGYRELVHRVQKEAEEMGLSFNPDLYLEINKHLPSIKLNSRPEGRLGGYRKSTNTIELDPDLLSPIEGKYVPFHEGLHWLRVGTPELNSPLYNRWKLNMRDELAWHDFYHSEEYSKLKYEDNAKAYARKKVKEALYEDADPYLSIPGELLANGLEAGRAIGLEPFAEYPGYGKALEAVEKARNYNKWLHDVKAGTTLEMLNFWKILTGNYLPAVSIPLTTGYTLYNIFNQPLQQLQYLKQGGKIQKYQEGKNIELSDNTRVVNPSVIPYINVYRNPKEKYRLIDLGGTPEENIKKAERDKTIDRLKRRFGLVDGKNPFSGLNKTFGTAISIASLFYGGGWALNRLLHGNKASNLGLFFGKYVLPSNTLDNVNDGLLFVIEPNVSGAVDLGTGLILGRYKDFSKPTRLIGELIGQGANINNMKIGGILQFLKNGSGIHIKESKKGSFTKYCNGKVTDECIAKGKRSPSAAIRKKATFADNARHFKHRSGGLIVQEFKLRKMLNNIINN